MPRPRVERAHAGLIGAVLWMALVLGLYYWVHKPLTPALAEALGGALLDLAVTAALAALAAGCRCGISRRGGACSACSNQKKRAELARPLQVFDNVCRTVCRTSARQAHRNLWLRLTGVTLYRSQGRLS